MRPRLQHLDRVVRHRVALDAIRERPAPERFALDVARMGCGDPVRRKMVHNARVIADFMDPDEAGADALHTLSDQLQFGEPEDCARGVGALWATLHPFRAAARGRVTVNPYDPGSIYVGQLTDEAAAHALDEASGLPRPRPVRLARRAEEMDSLLADDPDNRVTDDPFYASTPYTNDYAAALLAVAERALTEVRRIVEQIKSLLIISWGAGNFRSPSGEALDVDRVKDVRVVQGLLDRVTEMRRALNAAEKWAARVQSGRDRHWSARRIARGAQVTYDTIRSAWNAVDPVSAEVTAGGELLYGELRDFAIDAGYDAEESPEIADLAERAKDLAREVHNTLLYFWNSADNLERLGEWEAQLAVKPRRGQSKVVPTVTTVDPEYKALRDHFPELYPEES